VAIDDVLPLKAAQRDATANLNVLGHGDTADLISIASFTFDMRRHLIRLASAPFTPTLWQSLVGFRLLTSMCEERRWRRMRNLRTVRKNYGPILSRLWTKVHQILGRRSEPLVCSNALVRLSMSCFIPKIFAVKSRSRRKTEQMSIKQSII